MPPNFLEPEEVNRMMELAENPYRPKEILDLEEEIEGEKRALGVNYASTGVMDKKRALKIVEMMHQKDALYTAWVRGDIK